MLNLLPTPSPNHLQYRDAPLHSLGGSATFPTHDELAFLGLDKDSPQTFAEAGYLASEAPGASADGSGESLQDAVSNLTACLGSQSSDFDFQSSIWGLPPTFSMSHVSSFSPPSGPCRDNRPRKNRKSCHRRAGDYASTSPSQFDVEFGMMERSNNKLITHSLLQIYHDVLENNLVCWLADDTCPYKMRKRSDRLAKMNIGSAAVTFMQGGAPILPEWGGVWSNRIYRRVTHLDQVARASRMVRLTRAESNSASRALDLVVMAFASQFSQGRKLRRPCRLGSADPSELDEPQDIADELAEEFEQNLQLSVWEQAKRALQDVSEVESYKVVYAELIFGLTQRPRTNHDSANDLYLPTGKAPGARSSVAPRVMDIMSRDGPPTFLERAARKIQSLKYNFEANESGFMETSQSYQQHKDTRKIDMEERGTIGMLYWLAVMFDTVSSSMNERPIALADEECQNDAAEKRAKAAAASKAQQSSHRWDLNLFAQDGPETLHWPCGYDLAAEAVTRSAPIKVLLFRHVSYLQNALRKKCYPLVEEIIQSTISTYRYWNTTYGAFFRDLVRDYDAVPPRIKSWFICMAVPWHLGSLMLSDLIDFVDKNSLGSKEATASRVNSKMTARIRTSSAIELSDLARVTSPQANKEGINTPADQLPDLHFAVNQGPLLTEPWTVLLIRAFAKAALYHLGVAEDLRQHECDVLGHDDNDLEQSLTRSEYCITALWSLGRKSQMAKDIAEILHQDCTNSPRLPVSTTLPLSMKDIQVFIADATNLVNRAFWSTLSESTTTIPALYLGSIIGESFLNHTGWRWSYGTWSIVTPIVAIPRIAIVTVLQMRAKKHGLQAKSFASITGCTADRPIWKKVFHLIWTEIDFLGLVLLIGSFNPHRWKEGSFIAMLVTGVLCFMGSLVWDLKVAKKPYIPWKMANRTVIAGCAIQMFNFLGYSLFTIFFPSYLQVVGHFSPAHATRIDNSLQVAFQIAGLLVAVGMKYTKNARYWLLAGPPLVMLGQGLMVYLVDTPSGGHGSQVAFIASKVVSDIGRTLFQTAGQASVQAIVIPTKACSRDSISGAVWRNTLPNKLSQFLPEKEKGSAPMIFQSIVNAME
ncbi:hypothetical protein FZEAL_6148 [Fusarium zealandicum]|uniref:Uncharacterized protein n=1 Tax=Fusarium zealandicum TaxID=1053134 RepID=A0A8H4UII4_9HYPO|nr:hypothetical protein FZEAL_6148 [Fusarium zealandicum]